MFTISLPRVVESVPVVIDAPSFINDLMELGIDHDLVAAQLTLDGLRQALNDSINYGLPAHEAHNITMHFIFAKKLCGPANGKFTQTEMDALLERLMRETGVNVEEIDLPGHVEKRVDVLVQSRIEEFARAHRQVVLVVGDQDYVPVLRRLRVRGCRVIVASLRRDFLKQLAGETWRVVDLLPLQDGLFTYSYPVFKAATFTLSECRTMIANADDRLLNQVRISESGDVFISKDAVGNRGLAGIKFCLETFDAGNSYSGPLAASDRSHVEETFCDIREAWQMGYRGHI
jgi:hypothetical protein